MKQISFLIAQIAGQPVALDVNAVRAVLPTDEITPVPLAPPMVVGISTKRGRVLTVIDARACISAGTFPSIGESIVVKIGTHRYMLLVDAIGDVVTVQAEDVLSPPPGMQPGWNNIATGAIRTDGQELALVIRLEHFIEMGLAGRAAA